MTRVLRSHSPITWCPMPITGLFTCHSAEFVIRQNSRTCDSLKSYCIGSWKMCYCMCVRTTCGFSTMSTLPHFSLAVQDHLDQSWPNYGPRIRPANAFSVARLSRMIFIVIFLVWFLVTRINCLARYKYEWGYANIIPPKRKAKQCLRNMREFLYIRVQRAVKICGSFLMFQVHPPGQLSRTSLTSHLSLNTIN